MERQHADLAGAHRVGGQARVLFVLCMLQASYAPPLAVQSSMHAAVRMYASCLESLQLCPHICSSNQPLFFLPSSVAAFRFFQDRVVDEEQVKRRRPSNLFSSLATRSHTPPCSRYSRCLARNIGCTWILLCAKRVAACSCICCTSTTKLRFGGRLPRECKLTRTTAATAPARLSTFPSSNRFFLLCHGRIPAL